MIRYRCDILQIFLNLTDRLFLCKWHHLDNEASCTCHCIIFIHQHPKSYRGWHLLRIGKIVRQIFRNFTGYQNGLSGVWLFESHIFNNLEKPDSNSTAYIQLSILWRQHDIRMIYITFHISLAVRSNCNPAKRSVSSYLKCQHICIILHHTSHHSSCSKKSSQCCGCHRAGIMMFSGRFHKFFCCCSKRSYLSVCCGCSYDIVVHIYSFPSSVFLFLFR